MKSVTDLHDLLDKLNSTWDDVEASMKSSFMTILMGHEGWDERVFETYWQAGTIPQMVWRTYDYYRG